MKLFIFFLFLAVNVYLAISAPMEEFDSLNQNLVADKEQEEHSRVRRFTCDVLAMFGPQVTRSACATHCLFLGKHGGDCQNAMCVCRSENIVETFNKQFG